jgi:bifunctional aspartokinase / homoserine dehydrogenase 1
VGDPRPEKLRELRLNVLAPSSPLARVCAQPSTALEAFVSFSGSAEVPASADLSNLPQERRAMFSAFSVSSQANVPAPHFGRGVVHFPRHRMLRKFHGAEKPLLVMKFGGTSVGDADSIAKVLQIVREAQSTHTVLVVVSAMARVTDSLIDAAVCSAGGDANVASAIFDALKSRHQQAAEVLLRSSVERDRFDRKMQSCLREGWEACQETGLAGHVTPKARDFISSLGERLCAPLVAAALRDCEIASEAVDARECLVTDSQHGSANPAIDLTRERCENRLRPLLGQGVVPVVTGFLGTTVDGALTTLGRGGSDYSASILGAALQAHEVIIWTDVDGFLTSDPRLVPDACTIPEISYQQAAALAYFGAKVLHPRTLQPLVQRGISVWIRNTFAAEREGTRISIEGPAGEAEVKALAAMKDISLVTLRVSRIEETPAALRRAIAAASAAGVDVVSAVQTDSPLKLGLVVRSSLAEQTLHRLRTEFTMEPNVYEFGVQNGAALVTLVSQNARHLAGVIQQACTILSQESVHVFAGSQDVSGCNVSFVVGLDAMQKALAALHKGFQLERLNSTLLASAKS